MWSTRGLGALTAVLLTLSVLTDRASAQETRAEQIEHQRAEKAKQLQPDTPGIVERGLFRIEDRFLVERVFNPPRGAFVRFGGLPEGSGIGAGPAYRHANHAMSFTATSAISITGSHEVDVRLAFPRPTLIPARASVAIGGRHRNLPDEDFYGLGNGSEHTARTAYAYRDTSVDVTGGFSPKKWFTLGGTVEYRTPRLQQARDRAFPSIEMRFSDGTAPGLDRQSDFFRIGARATIDYTAKPDGTLVGGRYTASYDKYADNDLGRYSFGQWDLDLQQYVPIVTSARSLVLRTHVSGLTPDDGEDVPFYLQPTLGGSHSLRSLRVHRLRDRNALLLQAEYRWDVNAFLTGVLFYDAGTVAFHRRDLDLHKLKDNYGVGVRLGFMNVAALRAEVVFGGDEGTVFALRFGDVF